MIKPTTIQQLLQQQFDEYTGTHKLDRQRLKVCGHLMNCHTPALGGIQYQCDHCDTRVPLYHSCRDRHCPQCQLHASHRWSERQQRDILPVTYYHLIFTLPHDLNGWVQLHPEVIYQLLFRVAWQTLKAFATDPKRLGGKLGMAAVMHTWGQDLGQHVHLHCLIPRGVLTENKAWYGASSTCLFPVRALSRRFRGRMVSALRECANAGELNRVTHAGKIDIMLNQLMKKAWVVYSKSCLNHTQSVVGYLAQYSHRIAISDQRIIGIEKESVHFRYKDYRDNKPKVMQLHCEEFIRRFLLHVLPKGLMRIRHYGLLANRCRRKSLEIIRKILAQPAETAEKEHRGEPPAYPCPTCKKGHLIAIRLLDPVWSYPGIAPG